METINQTPAILFSPAPDGAFKAPLLFRIPEEQGGQSLRSLLRRIGFSRHSLIRLREEGKILVNGKDLYLTSSLNPGDEVYLDPYSSQSAQFPPEEIPLDILYEDPDYILVNKPAGLTSHPSGSLRTGSLAAGVLYHLLQEGITTVHPVTRLDRTTSGIMVFAKHPAAQHFLTQDSGTKEYAALAEGLIAEKEGTVEEPILKAPGPTIRRIVDPEGKEARTSFKVLARGKGRTLLSLTLHTGRTHQIRVHLAHLGHPVAGDFLYGREDLPRLFLHSHIFTFRHFRRNLEIQVTAPLPEEFLLYLSPEKPGAHHPS